MGFIMFGVLVGIDNGFSIRWAYRFMIAYPIAFFLGYSVRNMINKVFPKE